MWVSNIWKGPALFQTIPLWRPQAEKWSQHWSEFNRTWKNKSSGMFRLWEEREQLPFVGFKGGGSNRRNYTYRHSILMKTQPQLILLNKAKGLLAQHRDRSNTWQPTCHLITTPPAHLLGVRLCIGKNQDQWFPHYLVVEASQQFLPWHAAEWFHPQDPVKEPPKLGEAGK